VKDEGLLDRFDQVFNKVFKGLLTDYGQRPVDIPEDWLRAVAEKVPRRREMAAIEKLGSWEGIMETLRERLEEQRSAIRAETNGSELAAPARSAIAATTRKACASAARASTAARSRSGRSANSPNLDNTKELGTRNIKIALRRLRRFAREGHADELDLPGAIEGTARAGLCSISACGPKRRNAVKLLLFLDVGGSMDPFIKLVEELFSAATADFENMEFFYFHNCLYEGVWKDNERRWSRTHRHLGHSPQSTGTTSKIVFIGDVPMTPTRWPRPAVRSSISTRKPVPSGSRRVAQDLSGHHLARCCARKAVGLFAVDQDDQGLGRWLDVQPHARRAGRRNAGSSHARSIDRADRRTAGRGNRELVQTGLRLPSRRRLKPVHRNRGKVAAMSDDENLTTGPRRMAAST